MSVVGRNSKKVVSPNAFWTLSNIVRISFSMLKKGVHTFSSIVLTSSLERESPTDRVQRPALRESGVGRPRSSHCDFNLERIQGLDLFEGPLVGQAELSGSRLDCLESEVKLTTRTNQIRLGHKLGLVHLL